MNDSTNPDIELLQAVPTRVADVSEFERELVAAAEAPEGEGGTDDLDEAPTRHALLLPLERTSEPGPRGEPPGLDQVLDDDEAPTKFIQLPPQVATDSRAWDAEPARPNPRACFEDTPILPLAPRARFRRWAAVVVLSCAAGAAAAGFLAGLIMDDEPEAVASVPAAVAAEPPAQPAAEQPAATVATPTAVVPAPATSVAAPAKPAPDSASAAEAEPRQSPLRDARDAIDDADVDAAVAALERARAAGAEPASVDRLRAQLMVLRGDGAEAVPELRAMTRAYADDAAIWLAVARALAQAEDDAAAKQAFRRTLELDAHSVHAYVGLARLATRAAALAAARQHLDSAREAYERGEPDPALEARLHVTEGIIGFELGDYDGARSHAQSALELDDRSAEAHLLLGRIAIQQDRDPTAHLRAAVDGRAPFAEAVGMLVPRTGRDACQLAERYLAIAPDGYDAPEVRRAQRDCP